MGWYVVFRRLYGTGVLRRPAVRPPLVVSVPLTFQTTDILPITELIFFRNIVDIASSPDLSKKLIDAVEQMTTTAFNHKLCIGALAILLWIAFSATHVYANGRVVNFDQQVAGPYEVALGIAPPSPGIGPIHIAIKVTDASTRLSIANATINVSGFGPSSNAINFGPVIAQNDATNPIFYEATTNVDQEGTWFFRVYVDGPLGEASADFPIKIRSASPIPGIVTLVVLITLLLIISLSFRSSIRNRSKL